MSNYLCIRINDEYLHPWSIVPWAVLDIDSQITSSGASLLQNLSAEVPEFDSSMRCVAVVPGNFVLTKSVSLPKAQQSHIKQALPFLIEEHLIDPIEVTHLASAPLIVNEAVSVACVKRVYMRNWLDTLESAGIHPDQMYADYLCLPFAQDNAISMLVDDDAVLICHRDQTGLALPPLAVESMIRVILNDLEREHSQVNLYGAGEENAALQTSLKKESNLLRQHLDNEAATLSEFDESQADEAKSVDQSTTIADDENELDQTTHIPDKLLIDKIKQLVQSENIQANTEQLAETFAQVLFIGAVQQVDRCLLYTSDAADES